MSRKVRTTIYVPPELWEKAMAIARRDGLKLSNVIEELLRTWVNKKDPGNPQRPITAFVNGHPDHLRAAYQKVLRLFQSYAEWRPITYKAIIRRLKLEGVEDPRARASLAEEISREFRKAGRRVYR